MKKNEPQEHVNPEFSDRGVGVMSKHGVLGYASPTKDGTLTFMPLAFSAEGRAQGLAKVLRNRTTIEHSVTPIMCRSVFVAQRVMAPTANPQIIEPDGKAARRTQIVVGRKRRKEAREAKMTEFIASNP